MNADEGKLNKQGYQPESEGDVGPEESEGHETNSPQEDFDRYG